MPVVKLSNQIKEIIQIVVFLLVVGALIAFYVVYPLGRSRAMTGRVDEAEFGLDSLPQNDPAGFENLGLALDTFRVEADGITSLACLRLSAPDDTSGAPPDSSLGTAIIIPDARETRDSLETVIGRLAGLGYTVFTYDQRASGRTSGKYHGEGQLEATDLQALIAYLDLRGWLHHPVSVIGFGLGGEAAILVEKEESRIDRVIAVDPPLSTERYYARLMSDLGVWWFPFRESILWFWYTTRSGYAADFRTTDDIGRVRIPTWVLVPTEAIESDEVNKLAEVSADSLLTVVPLETAPLEAGPQIESILNE
jgi:hypothetical protein